MVRIYLDACCLNRPFDDQSQTRIRLEAEAVLSIIQRAEAGDFTLLGSSALEYEVERTPNFQRRARLGEVLLAINERVTVGREELLRAKHWQRHSRLAAVDALYLACAESQRADVFLTVDDRLLRAVNRTPDSKLPFRVVNPLPWLTES